MLDRALRQILPLRNALRLAPAFNERTGDSPLPKVHRQRQSDRASAHDDDLVPHHSGSIPAADAAMRRK
jgi:hypothetical protein